MFRIDRKDKKTKARTGILETAHGEVKTPVFLPVATKGTVKTLDFSDLESLGVQGVIVNAFHLWLKGLDSVKNAGGLHDFMRWNGPIFTDSGGFQIIRKDFDFKISREGFVLKSPVDGKKVTYSPEVCMEVHSALGSDVAFVLDDCPPYGSPTERLKESVDRTTDWARRCKAMKCKEQEVYAITQGGIDAELRKRSGQELSEIGFDGYGIGGLSIGEPRDEMISILEISVSSLSEDKPKHMMGVGSPAEVLESIANGVDIFDSAFPTRNARHGTFYTQKGKFDIKKSGFAEVKDPLGSGCECFACKNYSTSYIHHLFKEKEMLAYRLLSIHNLKMVLDLFSRVRMAIRDDTFPVFAEDYLSEFSA
ncbi:MAG: tRNA guanosine(34) transglycosylase Tgt [Methanobacteriota archaeon]|nr:MAG: tRNA guanosine(34) transglycosylase Tgt [Euryarchaeota archaeon]